MITVNDITFGYNRHHAVLKDFSLDFQGGGVYGLLGKNGTGKSTLLYLIMGLLRPSSGSVQVDGMEAAKRLPEMMK